MSYNGLANLEKWLAAKSKKSAPAQRAHNSTLAVSKKPIAKFGAKAKREAPAKKAAREAVFARDAMCVVCEMFGKPEKELMSGPDHWAHVHGRTTHKGADKVSHPAFSVRLCPTHHQWHHGKGSHSLGIVVTPRGNGFKQHFTVDGVLNDSRIVKPVKAQE